MERRPPRRALTDTSYGLGAAVTPTTIASPRSFSFVSSSAFAFSNIPPPTGSLSLRLLPPPPPGEPPFPFPFPPPPVNRSMGFKNIPPPTEANTTAPAAKTPHNDDDDDDNDSRGGPPEKVGASHPGIERRAAPTAEAGTGERKASAAGAEEWMEAPTRERDLDAVPSEVGARATPRPSGRRSEWIEAVDPTAAAAALPDDEAT
mmetsp:Transcript_18129/g.37160  ORF Transcript_18129/g.37160 Transcript_18129/m.37160 type:complete len:204 (+) Transcript_18129:1177-1788(+)